MFCQSKEQDEQCLTHKGQCQEDGELGVPSKLGGDTGAETVNRDLLAGSGLSTKDLLVRDGELCSKDLLTGGGLSTKDMLVGDDELLSKDLLIGDDKQRSKDLLAGTVEVLIEKLLTEAADSCKVKQKQGPKPCGLKRHLNYPQIQMIDEE